jgi:hypothetical protein
VLIIIRRAEEQNGATGRFETLLLGSAAVHYEGKLLWDPRQGEITNLQDAKRWVKPQFRKGWEIKL